MNARRLNDLLKLVGAVSAALLAVGPFLPPGSTVKAYVVGAAAFLAGIGTRGFGLEYQDVADAKAVAKASLVPPPMVVVNAAQPAAAAPTEAPR